MSTFNADTFLNTQVNDSNATTFEPIPVGEDYQASIAKIEPRMAGDKPVLEVTWQTSDPRAVEATGMDTPTVRQTIWLDVTESGGLDLGRGKNVGLGKLRAALNQNQPGVAWAPGMLIGQSAMLKISHRAGKSPDEVYAQVAGVTAL